MSDDMSAYREVFLSESAEYIQSITDGLLALESDPHDLEPVETIFRGAHSLKGMAAAMGYDRTAELTHKMESLMDTVRQRLQPIDSSLIDLMLRAVDSVRDLIEDESSGRNTVDVGELVRALIERTEHRSVPGEGGVPGGDDEAQSVTRVEVDEGSKFLVAVSLAEECVLKAVRAYMAIKRLGHMGTVVETHPSARQIEDEEFDRTFEVVLKTRENAEAVKAAVSVISEVADVSVTELEQERVVGVEPETKAAEVRRSVPKIAETQTVRISIGHLDNMVNLVGELVIIRSRLDKIAKDLGSVELRETLGVLEQVSGDLQHEVMQTRMVPVGNIFNRFPRMVRDLARDLGKDVAFEMEGLDIELDRTVLDEIGDPIVHLLRNSIDHGVEMPALREEKGKPARGTVRLIAQREREQVKVIVTDDGAGMDAEVIWRKAVDRGMVAAADRDSYSEQDILLLTCAPGFSTAKEATKVSGRGVGMDVVKGKIEYLGGTLSVRSKPDIGTEMVLSLPLTLAIIQALLVASAEQVFAVPLSAVSEVLSQEEVKLKTVDGSPVVVLRDGAVAPLYLLDEIIGVAKRGSRRPSTSEHIVLMEMNEQTNALAVEGLVGRQEVVIKPLSPLFKGLRGLGGATVLGDGRVALILDPRTLFAMGG